MAFLAFSTVAAQPLDKKVLREKGIQLLQGCKEKVKASDTDLKQLMSHSIPESPEGLCMLECVFDTSKLMQNGKYSKSGFIQGLQPLIGDDQSKRKNVEKLASACEKEIGNAEQDKCQIAKLLVQCIVKNSGSYGINIPTPGA